MRDSDGLSALRRSLGSHEIDPLEINISLNALGIILPKNTRQA